MNDLQRVTAVVLCGGLGTRLRPVVSDKPKVLAEIRGRPFLTCLFDQLNDGGVRKAVLCTGYLGEQIRAEFGDSYGKLQLLYSQEPEQLGTGGALRHALPVLENEYTLVMNGDSYCNIDLEAFWIWFSERKLSLSIVVTGVPDCGRYGQVKIATDGRITHFVEKGEYRGAGWINAGIYLLDNKFVRSIPPERLVSLEHEMFPAWVDHGMYGYMTGAEFIDIGTPESYELAELHLIPRRACEQAPLCCVGS